MTETRTYPEAPPAASMAVQSAPFLVWPVARREFYTAIATAMMPTLLWGSLIFGWRAFVLVCAVLLGASTTHLLLRWLTYRGKRLLMAHTLVSALIVAGLSNPAWPAWTLFGAGAALTALVFVLGGPGRERIPPAMLVAAALYAFTLQPTLPAQTTLQADMTATGGAILARDRLFMGDIKDASFHPPAQWPESRQINGDDALAMARPAIVANDLLAGVELPRGTPAPRDAARDLALRTAPLVDHALVNVLPSIDAVVWGAAPGSIGCVSAAGILLGGMYLAYRNILRPRSCAVFLMAFVAGLVLCSPGVWLGVLNFARVWQAMPSTLVTLLGYSFFGSDVLFAAVFILALPGAEPITPRGRMVFLVCAGAAAAALHRLTPAAVLPSATLTLAALQPLCPLYDRLFAHRSWLAR